MSQLSSPTFSTLAPPTFASAIEIDLFFKTRTGFDFIDWFNERLAGKGAFADRRIRPEGTEQMLDVKREFIEFWNEIPVIFKKPAISLFDFAALMCIAINEQGGRFRSKTEVCGRGARDKAGRRHEGVSYAFDVLPNIKKSYNTLAGNRTAHACFSDPVYCRAHADLALADRLAAGTNSNIVLSEAWQGETYPFEEFPVVEDMAQIGFVMQADFYKFRGRGPIQITGRAPYAKLAEFVLKYTGTNPVLLRYRDLWRGLSPDDACSTSRDKDWDEIFAQKEVATRSLRIYADFATPSKNLYSIDLELEKLNGQRIGSLYRVGRTISGSEKYATEKYLPRVVQMLEELGRGRTL